MSSIYESWIEAFQIFLKYCPDCGNIASIEPDVVYAGPEPENVSSEDIMRLAVLGWEVSEQNECFYTYV